MARHRGKYIVLFAALLILTGLTAQSTAYVPDFIAVSEQPETIDADGQSTTSITAQLMADINGMKDIVKKCGVEIACESENTSILNNGTGGSTLADFTDAFGKVKFTFKSTGSESDNEGVVTVICRSLQLLEGKSNVTAKTWAATHFHITQCPKSGYDNLDQATKDELALDSNFTLDDAQADILADGFSKVFITAQLKNDLENPVHKNGTLRFQSMNTTFVKTCGATNWSLNALMYPQNIFDTGTVLVKSDNDGVATAEFCSAGNGSSNIGVSEIRIECIDYADVIMNTTYVKTTNEFGTTYKDGYLAMTSMPDQIMADSASCVSICAQARDQNYRIIRKDNWTALLESEDTSRLVASPRASDTGHGLANATTGNESIALHKYCSAGKFDDLNVGPVIVRGSAPTLMQEASTSVDLRTEQIWPVGLEVKATMPLVDCDGISTVTVTAQLLDRYGLATKFQNRTVTFKSGDISRLKNSYDGTSTVFAKTDKFGKANATFITTDCKSGGIDGNVTITVSTQSPAISNTTTVLVIKPLGFVPDAVSVYSDQGLLGFNSSYPAHAKPYLLSADGMKKTYVTAQLCEFTGINDVVEDSENLSTGTRRYCNPVKRPNVEIEFEVLSTQVVQNRGDNYDPFHENNIAYVKLKTDAEGKTTAVFTSAGDAPVNKDKCTLIKVTAKNGELLGSAYSEVCTKGKEGISPNAIWIWADPAIISADGTSHTVIRSAMYFCENHLPEARSLSQVKNYTYLKDNCKPVQIQGVTVKFETINTSVIDDGMGGYNIYSTTDKFGQANATFQSKGSDTQHISPAEIQAWTIGSGENVTQLNKLVVFLEEKTWPWCPVEDQFTEDSPEATADKDHDQFITDNELIDYIINVWLKPFNQSTNPYGDDDAALIQVILAWLNQL